MKKGQKIALITSVVVAGIITWVLINRSRKNKEVDLIMRWLGEKPDLKNAESNKATLEAMSTDVNIIPEDKKAKAKADLDRLGGYKGLSNIAKDLYDSMQGVGTDTTKFFNAINKIPSLYIFKMVESIYKLGYKSDLLKDIEGEVKLGGVFPSNVLTDPLGVLKGQQNTIKQMIYAKPMY